MPELNVTSRGQVTLRKEYLKHLSVEHGGKVDVQFDGECVTLRATKPKGSIKEFFGIAKGKTNGAYLSIEEINDAIGQAAADEVIASMNR